MRKNMLVSGSPRIENDEIEEVVKCMKSAWLGTGPRVAEFERDFSRYIGARYSAAVNSCTAALHLSLLASGVKKGDEVITTAMTFCATVNAIIHSGATPVVADVDPVTMNIDPAEIEKKVTKRTKALVIVHFAGLPCDMAAIMKIVKRHRLILIEDCAHAIESEYRGSNMGTFGDFGCFSFYVTKNITTGEGGMVVSKTEKGIARVKILSLHGMTKDAWQRFGDKGYKHYCVVESGYKYNMMDLQAAIGLHQLKKVDGYWLRRKQIWERYTKELADLPVVLPCDPGGVYKHAYHLFPLLINTKLAGISRDQFINEMTKRNIGVGVHYLSLPEHPFYKKTFGWKPADYPNAMKIGRETVSIPLSAKLSDKDVSDVIEAVRGTIK